MDNNIVTVPLSIMTHDGNENVIGSVSIESNKVKYVTSGVLSFTSGMYKTDNGFVLAKIILFAELAEEETNSG